MSLPKVSIAIPVYNRETLVQRAIESALAQTYSEIEIIVVDNCSSDNTYEVIQKYAQIDKRVKCFRNERNIGPVPNWQRAVEKSQGEYVKILFSDDWMEPQALERFVQPFQEYDTNISFTYSRAIIHYLESEETRECYQNIQGGLMDSLDFLWEHIIWANTPVTPCMALFRRSDLLEFFTLKIPSKVRSDCNNYGIGNDALLYWRGCEKYSSCYHISEPVMNLGASVSVEQPSFTISLINSGKMDMLCQCYDSAFCYFLAHSNLPKKSKNLLVTGMFLRRMPFRPWLIKSKIAEFNRIFPTGYKWWNFNFINKHILGLLKYRIVGSWQKTFN